MDQPTELAKAALLGRVQHRSRGEKEQALEERVIERVIERRGERDRGEQRLIVALEENRQPDSRDDDADVLDRRIGEEPLHVGLHGGEEHAEERGEQPEHEREYTPPPELEAEQIEAYAQQSVDRRLEHDAAHER